MTSRNGQEANERKATVITMVLPEGYSVWLAAPDDGYYILTDWAAQGEKGNNITVSVSPLMNTTIDWVTL